MMGARLTLLPLLAACPYDWLERSTWSGVVEVEPPKRTVIRLHSDLSTGTAYPDSHVELGPIGWTWLDASTDRHSTPVRKGWIEVSSTCGALVGDAVVWRLDDDMGTWPDALCPLHCPDGQVECAAEVSFELEAKGGHAVEVQLEARTHLYGIGYSLRPPDDGEYYITLDLIEIVQE
jgi:hypothetical protein